MSNRKDNKGRVLHRGEGQRPDGRYSFKYTNWMGKNLLCLFVDFDNSRPNATRQKERPLLKTKRAAGSKRPLRPHCT